MMAQYQSQQLSSSLSTVPQIPHVPTLQQTRRLSGSFRHNPYSTECTFEDMTTVGNLSFSSALSVPSSAPVEPTPPMPCLQQEQGSRSITVSVDHPRRVSQPELLSPGGFFSDTTSSPRHDSLTSGSLRSNSPDATPPPSPPVSGRHAHQPRRSSAPRVPPLGFEITVQHKHGRTSSYIHGEELALSAHVIVEGDRGSDLGMVVACRPLTELDDVKGKGNKVRRAATGDEVSVWREGLVQEEAKAMKYIKHQVARYNIPITVHKAEFQFDRKKLTFHYTTEAEHPDFRSLLKEGYRQFRCRIWLNNCNPRGNDPGQALPFTEEFSKSA